MPHLIYKSSSCRHVKIAHVTPSSHTAPSLLHIHPLAASIPPLRPSLCLRLICFAYISCLILFLASGCSAHSSQPCLSFVLHLFAFFFFWPLLLFILFVCLFVFPL